MVRCRKLSGLTQLKTMVPRDTFLQMSCFLIVNKPSSTRARTVSMLARFTELFLGTAEKS